MEFAHFFYRLTRPAEDPMSFHPAFLNAIYANACFFEGDELAAFAPYFARQTQYYLHESLAYADRLTDFMWASVMLGSYMIGIHSLDEAYAVVSACVRFALACGLDGAVPVTGDDSSPRPQIPLLDPPLDNEEARNRMHLSRAIYSLDRTLVMIAGFPSAFVNSTAQSLECLSSTAAIASNNTFKTSTIAQPGMSSNNVSLCCVLTVREA